MKILITGDLVIDKEYSKSNIDSSIASLFNNSDLNIVNLEAPVTKNNSKIFKTGPHVKSKRKSVLNIFEVLRVNMVTLANNHILDYGEQGLIDTLEFCKENNIKTVGAGSNLKEASKTQYLNTEEGIIAIVNFAENEWTIATDNRAGANPMDIIDNANQIKDAKENADFVMVIIHGGHEFYNLPSPRMKKQYRFYAEQGADIVIAHHPHCISGNEVYNGIPIFYSLGNFIFTWNIENKDWYIGLILEIDITNGAIKTNLHLIKQNEKNFNLSFIDNEEKQSIFCRINKYNEIILNDEELQEKWDNYLDYKSSFYLKYWSPTSFIPNRYIKGAFRRLPFKIINKSGLATYKNFMRCEAHRDMSIEIIERYIDK